MERPRCVEQKRREDDARSLENYFYYSSPSHDKKRKSARFVRPAGAQVRRNWRRRFTRTVIGASGVARRRWCRGRTSERGAAYSRRTDRSATGISEASQFRPALTYS